MIPFNQINTINKRFFDIFHCSLHKFVDHILSAGTGNIEFDVIEFDEYLIRKFGYDIDEHGRVEDFLKNHISEEANELIDSLII